MFRDLCLSFERLPGHPERRVSEHQLRTLFGISLSPIPEHCDEIWKRTASILSECSKTISDAKKAKEELSIPVWEPFAPADSEAFRILPEQKATDYAEWSRIQKAEVGSRMRFDLPEGFHAESPDLYHVNRHLSGEEPNENLWICQKVRFLCETCSATGGELLFHTPCATEELPRLLRMLASQVSIPRFYWIFDEK